VAGWGEGVMEAQLLQQSLVSDSNSSDDFPFVIHAFGILRLHQSCME
jgi:hypothetical protein